MAHVNRVERGSAQHPYWDELVTGCGGIDVTVGERRFRVAAVPLFQEREGALRQGVRIASTGGGQLRAVMSDDEGELDRGALPPSDEAGSLVLFVPEVSERRSFDLTLTASAAAVTTTIEVTPQRKWTVDVIHHSHLDIGYTDPQAMVLVQQLGYIDAALDLMDLTDDEPDDAKFRWNIEVTWPLRHWLRRRPAAARERLMARMREGRLEVNALPFSMHTEAYAIDELAHTLDFATELRDLYGVPIESAMQTDVPGATVGLATLLTDAGVRNLAVAHNYAGRSIPYLLDGQELRRPFWWQAPNGMRLLVWYTDTAIGNAYMEGTNAGLATGYDAAAAVLPEYLLALATRPYPYGTRFGWAGPNPAFPMMRAPDGIDVLHLRVQGEYADNAPPSLKVAETVRQWNETWAWPRLRMAINRDFFDTVRERYGDELPLYEGDWTDWWADGIGSAAIELGLNREAQRGIRTAQTLHAIADRIEGAPQPGVKEQVAAVYDDLSLFDEHTWGAANPWGARAEQGSSGARQWGRKAAFAHEAHEATAALLDWATARLAPLASVDEGTGIAVVNPSSWPRTDLARVFIPEARLPGEERLAVHDARDGSELPCIVEPQTNPKYRPRGRWLTFLARDVPAMGFARFTVQPSDTDRSGAEMVMPDESLFTDALRVAFDAREAIIAAVEDRRTGRNLVNRDAAFGFGQYIYDRYTTAPGFNHLSSRTRAHDLSLLGSRATAGFGAVTRRERNAILDRVTWRAQGQGIDWLETTLTAVHGTGRLEVTHHVLKQPTPDKESVYVAFPFAIAAPEITFEITGGTASSFSPRVPGSARHFRAIRHWAAMRGTNGAVAWATVQAPLVQTGTIHLPYAPFPASTAIEPATIYSWALNNIWDTNFPHQQGGEMPLRYGIAVPAGDDEPLETTARSLGESIAAPLVGVVADLKRQDAAGPAAGSFVALDHPEVAITHIATSGEHDLICYLASTADEEREVTVRFPAWPVESAWIGNAQLRELAPVAVSGDRVTVTVPAGGYRALAVDLR